MTDSRPIQHVYGGHGTRTELPLGCADRDSELPRIPTIADLIPVTQIMSRAVICARRDLPVRALVELMIREHIGCIPVVDESGRPIGMITKLDLLEHWPASEPESEHEHLGVPTANDLMMPLAITLGERATVAHAAALMALEDVHHIPIVDELGRIIGVVSTMDLVRWLARNDGVASTLGH